MNNLVEKLYLYSPTPVQNLLTSVYGFSLYRERYGPESKPLLAMLAKSESYGASEMRALQEKHFVDLARHAISTVPHYSNWAKKEGIGSEDIQSLNALRIFPILTKNEIRKNPLSFVSSAYQGKRKLIKIHTSGTTGTPLQIYCDRMSRTHHYAFFSRLRSWFGLRPRSKRATLFGRIIMRPDVTKPPFWRHDVAQRNLLMSSYHLSNKNLQFYYEYLRRYSPEEIIGYPSSIYAIASYILRNNLPKLSPTVVITTAETLQDHQREAIGNAFDAALVDQYGSAEMAMFASDCEHGSMHIHPEHGLVETIDKSGKNIVGQPGNALMTGLVNKAMPLIRYEIGDRIALAGENRKCACHRAFPIIEKLEGRNDDVIYKIDGTPVGRLSPVFKGNEKIIESAVKQDSTGNITITVATEPSFGDADIRWLHQEMTKRVGSGLTLTIDRVETIPRQKNGKFRAVQSEYRPNNSVDNRS